MSVSCKENVLFPRRGDPPKSTQVEYDIRLLEDIRGRRMSGMALGVSFLDRLIVPANQGFVRFPMTRTLVSSSISQLCTHSKYPIAAISQKRIEDIPALILLKNFQHFWVSLPKRRSRGIAKVNQLNVSAHRSKIPEAWQFETMPSSSANMSEIKQYYM